MSQIETMHESVYQPLPRADSIRDLILYPGVENEPLVCSLHVSTLEDAEPYEAISYVWGSTQ
jgi:hypothetical protein